MEANFTNTERAEYTDPSATDAPARPRVVYASWHPDGLRMAITWVREFKDRLEGFDDDEFCVPLQSRIRDEPGLAGETNAAAREAIDTTVLGEVTDFIAVLTGPYFAVQKRLKVSELSWMIQVVEAKQQSCAIWTAVLERELKLRRIGEIHLEMFRHWHGTRDHPNVLEPFNLYGPEDLEGMQRFAGEVNSAVNRLRAHGRNCEICPRPS